jgi:hypothetical protein
MTLAEKWMAEGKARGEAEGEVRGKAEAVRKVLTVKFGELSHTTHRRIDAASSDNVDRWLERVLPAATIDAVLDA